MGGVADAKTIPVDHAGVCQRTGRLGSARSTTTATKRRTMSTESMPSIGHVAVTVTDLEASKAWYTRVLGVDPVLEEDTGPFKHVVYLLGTTLFGIHGFPELESKEKFSPRRPGLDHIAFGCANRDELSKWAARLDELDIAHGGIVDAGYGS